MKFLSAQILFYNSNFNLESKSVSRIPMQFLEGEIHAENENLDSENCYSKKGLGRTEDQLICR